MMTLGTLIIAVGIYFFKFPNNFATGGVTGISVILASLQSILSASDLVLIINTLLLIVGFIFVNKEFGFKTVYCSLLMSGSVWAFERLFPLSGSLTGEPLLDLVYAVLLPAIGSAMLFNDEASTGGTDIVAMIIKKYARINISKALLIADFLIVLCSLFVFGVRTWLFSLLAFFAKAFVVNGVLEAINVSKHCAVILPPDKLETVTDYITHQLKKGATVSDSFRGGYHGEPKALLLTVLTRRQTIQLKAFLKREVPEAFTIVSSTNEIIGKGFRETV